MAKPAPSSHYENRLLILCAGTLLPRRHKCGTNCCYAQPCLHVSADLRVRLLPLSSKFDCSTFREGMCFSSEKSAHWEHTKRVKGRRFPRHTLRYFGFSLFLATQVYIPSKVALASLISYHLPMLVTVSRSVIIIRCCRRRLVVIDSNLIPSSLLSLVLKSKPLRWHKCSNICDWARNPWGLVLMLHFNPLCWRIRSRSVACPAL